MKTKITTAVAITMLALAAFAAPAQAGGWKWGPAAGGFVAGTMIGAAAASAAPQPAYRCKVIEHYDQWGNFLGGEKVCRTWY
jgi:hypothetical protein